jgi:hypothetical protein
MVNGLKRGMSIGNTTLDGEVSVILLNERLEAYPTDESP